MKKFQSYSDLHKFVIQCQEDGLSTEECTGQLLAYDKPYDHSSDTISGASGGYTLDQIDKKMRDIRDTILGGDVLKSSSVAELLEQEVTKDARLAVCALTTPVITWVVASKKPDYNYDQDKIHRISKYSFDAIGQTAREIMQFNANAVNEYGIDSDRTVVKIAEGLEFLIGVRGARLASLAISVYMDSMLQVAAETVGKVRDGKS